MDVMSPSVGISQGFVSFERLGVMPHRELNCSGWYESNCMSVVCIARSRRAAIMQMDCTGWYDCCM